jgi:topoisomerase-4 subunit A
MVSRNKNGKALISLPEAAKVMIPQHITNMAVDNCLTITSEGRMLIFPVKNLPVLGKGKGNKIINIPTAKAKLREEFVSMLCIVPEGASVTLHAGKRKLTLKATDIEHYKGERGRRGNKLPRGLQRVSAVEVGLLACEVKEIDSGNIEVSD